jgi:prepilin-type N-terminal cleavage/methylation domain-containing protein
MMPYSLDFCMRAAFSLIELSIVLVILGLLTGGILTGQNLIRAAELRSVITEFQTYQTAVMTFRDKYFAIPGDMRNATDFWGSKGGNGADDTCYAVLATGKETCNGDGDGYATSNSLTAATSIQVERFLYWQHLANAGLIEGSYTGVTDGTSNYLMTAGVNSPGSKLSPGIWTINVQEGTPFQTNSFPHNGGYLYTLRVIEGTNKNRSPLIAEELWGLDMKMDDGLPGLGKVHTHTNTSSVAPGCATTDDAATAVYDVQYTDTKCHARFFVN